MAPETDEYALSTDMRSSWLYDAHAEDFIRSHKASGSGAPFFLYWALQDPHTPLSAPDYFLESEPCVDVADETRQVYCGMLRCIDTSVEALMVALSESGYYESTLVIFAGDNGGAPKNGGYNWPLRGSKGTLFQGGIRQASFAWGTMLEESVRGTTYYGPLHLVDMFPTFMSIATAGHWKPTFDYELDGVDVWFALSQGATSPRNVTLLNAIDDAGGVRIGDYSFLYNVKDDGWCVPRDAVCPCVRSCAPRVPFSLSRACARARALSLALACARLPLPWHPRAWALRTHPPPSAP